MSKLKLKRGMGEGGLSLVEVLASIVILTLLLTTFLMMFLQSAKVNKASEHIIDATYIAQEEMENIYALSTTIKHNAKEGAIKGLGYTNGSIESGWIVFEKGYNSNVLIKIKLQNKKGNMDRVIVEVRGIPDDNIQAQMENLVVWGAD
ncbi:hypothetical protein FQ087_03235 [Sporosarcina sp. ANT_H38]|uniref:hypothetical protein n=1 Tax=Sporosarcina sp. ANT_H38 TaxID=2597358 RepID=UPI0011F16F31|nr:hypothetical protein [Sporosarcina sp. ANT_H38]KAA0965335.1 hypothetical protein FQ087_03235 [Sporosarcina sp. ANT_H38]